MKPDPWQPILTAPHKGDIDIWAKKWMYHNDTFIYRRFTSCSFKHPDYWGGLEEGWFPVQWMHIPAPPSGESLAPQQKAKRKYYATHKEELRERGRKTYWKHRNAGEVSKVINGKRQWVKITLENPK